MDGCDGKLGSGWTVRTPSFGATCTATESWAARDCDWEIEAPPQNEKIKMEKRKREQHIHIFF